VVQTGIVPPLDHSGRAVVAVAVLVDLCQDRVVRAGVDDVCIKKEDFFFIKLLVLKN
jgi:hypothetical protein